MLSKSILKNSLCLVFFSAAFLTTSLFAQKLAKSEVETAMKKATRFMVEKVANHGGYVWSVSEDFKKFYGEIPARKSQIWVQSGTPMVGMALLDAFDATKDRYYLDSAQKAVDALVFGQRPVGGWHYMIDFEPKGVQEWYKNEASRFKWGMEEQRFFNGNATFDDGNTANATQFLLRFYLTSKIEKYRQPLLKALNFIMLAQYPNGAFPQRFPLHYDFVHEGFPDYTSYYTLNDGASNTNIEVLLEAYLKLGDKRYLESAKRGVDFMIAVQGPEDQAGWAEQYHPDTMQPVKARTHEPGGFVVRESEQVVELLELFYKMTGDRRYLRPIPACLQWFDRLNREAIEKKRPPARYYELGTNLPVYVLRTEKTNAEGYGLYEWSNVPQGNNQGSSGGWDSSQVRQVVNVEPIRKEYQRIAALSAKDARAEFDKWQKSDESFEIRPDAISAIIKSMDERGAWVTDCRVLTVIPREKGINPGSFEVIRGYSSGVFVRNLKVLLNSYKTLD